MSPLHHVPVTIRGVKCVLVMDHIGEVPPDDPCLEVSPPTDRHASIWVKEADVAAMRQKHGSLPLYGFWHTLLQNDILVSDFDALIYLTDRDHEAGAFCELRDGRAVTALDFYGGYPAGLNLGHAKHIDAAAIAAATTPKTPIRLDDEIRRARARWTRMAVLSTAGVVGGCAAIGWVADQWLAKAARDRQAKAAGIEQQTMATQASIADALATIDPITPNDRLRTRALLSRLAEVSSHLDTATVSDLNLASAADATLVVNKLPTDLSFPSIATISPGSPTTITFNLDGSAPPSATP